MASFVSLSAHSISLFQMMCSRFFLFVRFADFVAFVRLAADAACAGSKPFPPPAGPFRPWPQTDSGPDQRSRRHIHPVSTDLLPMGLPSPARPELPRYLDATCRSFLPGAFRTLQAFSILYHKNPPAAIGFYRQMVSPGLLDSNPCVISESIEYGNHESV